mmetsp:Transcript_90984/g.253268  ORF Transcript_90984/g.253268 Transcript_90984/m.253268 type:complete len:86 (+) Transcript_90984:57-314(+)
MLPSYCTEHDTIHELDNHCLVMGPPFVERSMLTNALLTLRTAGLLHRDSSSTYPVILSTAFSEVDQHVLPFLIDVRVRGQRKPDF